ncbi:MAG: putative selenium-dependent hydroxylase accessory protein YqeC [Synergistaceae bacterium]|nr:putative selenium-dependent hydroxylase accessory protein YqeC [Synergistaceae bacterium]
MDKRSTKEKMIRAVDDRLKIMKYKVISITGGGGKTSLMFDLGRYSAENVFTLLTTTTKIFPPQNDECPFKIIAGPNDLIKELKEVGHLPSIVTATKERTGEKLSGYTPEDINEIVSKSPVGRTIVEADGSRGLSLKAYEEWEPPVPAITDCHFIMMGADIFTEPLSPANVFRFDILKSKFSMQTGEYISFANCAATLSNRDEYLKNSPESALRILFINKCDLLTETMLAEISEKLPPMLKGYDHLIMGSIKMDKIFEIRDLIR